MKTLARLTCLSLLSMASAVAQTAAVDDVIFQGLGGKVGIQKIVGTLVTLIKSDARISESFKDSDMKNVAMRLEQQFCELGGGPCKYEGKTMVDVHDGLNITNAQFNALAEDLQLAMERNAVTSRIQNKLIAKLAPMQRGIVTK